MTVLDLQIIFRGTAVVQWPEDGGGVSTVLNSQSRSRRRRRSRLSAEETDEEQYLNQMICLYTRGIRDIGDIHAGYHDHLGHLGHKDPQGHSELLGHLGHRGHQFYHGQLGHREICKRDIRHSRVIRVKDMGVVTTKP